MPFSHFAFLLFLFFLWEAPASFAQNTNTEGYGLESLSLIVPDHYTKLDYSDNPPEGRSLSEWEELMNIGLPYDGVYRLSFFVRKKDLEQNGFGPVNFIDQGMMLEFAPELESELFDQLKLKKEILDYFFDPKGTVWIKPDVKNSTLLQNKGTNYSYHQPFLELGTIVDGSLSFFERLEPDPGKNCGLEVGFILTVKVSPALPSRQGEGKLAHITSCISSTGIGYYPGLSFLGEITE